MKQEFDYAIDETTHLWVEYKAHYDEPEPDVNFDGGWKVTILSITIQIESPIFNRNEVFIEVFDNKVEADNHTCNAVDILGRLIDTDYIEQLIIDTL